MTNNIFYTFWRYRSLVFELVKREFNASYRGSFGGIIWSFVHPIFLLSVYTLAFGVMLKARWGFSGDTAEYALMLFVGLIVLNIFSECLNRAPKLITSNPNFVKKVVFPLEIMAWISMLSSILHALISLFVWLLGYILFRGWPNLTVLYFPVILVVFVPVLLGVGWLLSALGVFVRDISQMTGMVSQALLFLTPIFFSAKMLPDFFQKLLLLNPLTFIVEQFRIVLYEGHAPDFKGLLIYFCITAIFAWGSFLIFKRLRPAFADAI
jgi:lipopolysaccharide transport system permease protein